MAVELRPATPDKYDVLMPMVLELQAMEGIDAGRDLESALRTLLAAPDVGRVFLVEYDGEPVGYAIVTYGYDLEFGGRDAFLTDFYLVPAARGKGIGAAAFGMVESEARHRGIRALHLAVRAGNDSAVRLYRKAGYEAWARTVLSKVLE